MNRQFAIIGCGSIAKRHAEQICRVGKLVAVCDIDREKSINFAQQYKARAYQNLEVLLNEEKDLSVISICSPNHLHAEHSIQCLRASKHVLCEKPLCLHPFDADAMISAAKEAGRKLWIVKQNRYNPLIIGLKQLLQNGHLGNITSFQVNCFWNRPDSYFLQSNWKGKRALDGGPLYTQFSHFIDLLIWLLGDISILSTTTANLQHPLLEIEDTGMALLQSSNSSIGSLHYTLNAAERNMEGSITLFGTKGTIKVGGQYLNKLDYISPGIELNDLSPVNSPNDYGFYQGSMSNHDIVYDKLTEELDTGTNLLPDAVEGAKSVSWIYKFYSSSKITL